MKNSSSPVEWIIDFTSNEQNSSVSGGKPSVNLIFPEQETTGQETARSGSQEKTYKALEFLHLIQDACRELKGECQETLELKTEVPYEEKLVNIKEDIKFLFGVIQEFTELMQMINPPPEEPPQEDPPTHS